MSDLDLVNQHLADVYVIDDLVFFRVVVGHQHTLQRCTLSELSALMQRHGSAIKAEIRAVNGPVDDQNLQDRLKMAKTQKKQGAALKTLLEQ